MPTLTSHFPFFQHNSDIVYLDSAATTQSLGTVIDHQNNFNLHCRANAHRSGHKMGTWIDQQYHKAKQLIGQWLNIDEPENAIVFNSGTTQALHDAVEIIKKEYSRATIYIGKDSHHSLFLPLRLLAFNSSFFKIKFIDIDSAGRLDLEKLEQELVNDKNPKILAVTAVSNVLGVINDLDKIRSISKQYGCATILDASQLIGKRKVNLKDFDFVAWSWHKIYGPTGLGCLVIDPKWQKSEPVRPGGGSVINVGFDNIIWQSTAGRFESGTQNLSAIAAIPGLVQWLMANEEEIANHDLHITKLAHSHVSRAMFMPISDSETGLICLAPTVGAVEDYAYMLDAKNVMVRTGKLCAEPLVNELSANRGLIRLSWAAYTRASEIERAFDVLGQVHEKLR
jgi:cysteine desulfurase/selenocysteine lyase